MRYAIALAITSLVVGCADRGPSDTVKQFYSTIERESESRELYDMTVGVGWEEFLVQRTSAMADFVARGGISTVTALSEDLDGTTAEVDVLLVYANGETEEFSVDLIRVDGQWRLRLDN